MKKRMIIMIVAVTVIIGGLLGFKLMMTIGAKKFLSSQPPPVQTVSTTQASMQDWQPQVEGVGSLRAINGADLSSEVSGIVDTVSFESGSDVEANATLVHLRDADDVARLHALEATANLAQITLDRDIKQLKGQAVSQALVDNDTAQLNAAKAQVDAQRALIAKKKICAPFAGRIGIRQVDIGQFVNAGTAIVTLQQLDPIYVDFSLPEQDLPQLSNNEKVTLTADALPQESFDGVVTAINSKIDEATRNVQVRATVKNPDRKLLPGMFVHVKIATGMPERRLTLPQTAITYNPYGNTVFAAVQNDKGALVARQTFVTLGPTRGDQVTVTSGVKEGDVVVTSGQLKLRNGTPIAVNNEIQPKEDANPDPKDN